MNKYLLTSLATIFMAGTALSQDDVATKKPVSPPPLSMVVDGGNGADSNAPPSDGSGGDGVAATPTDGGDDPKTTPVDGDSDGDAVAATTTDGGDDPKTTAIDSGDGTAATGVSGSGDDK